MDKVKCIGCSGSFQEEDTHWIDTGNGVPDYFKLFAIYCTACYSKREELADEHTT